MRKKPLLISFSGSDCSGKSTHIDLIVKSKLFSRRKIFVFWARGGYTPGFVTLKKILRIFLTKNLMPMGKSQKRQIIFKNKLICMIWIHLALLDLIFFWVLVIRFKLLFGSIVICDRYIDDTKLDFIYNFPNLEFQKLLLWKFLVFAKPKPDISFLLSLSNKEIIKRSKLKNEPFPDSYETIKWRSNQYLNQLIFNDKDYRRVDADQTIQTISTLIQKHIADLK